MRTTRAFVITVAVLALLALPGALASGWAQTPAAPAPAAPSAGPGSSGSGAFIAAAILMVGLLVILGAAVKFFDLRRKREAEAVHLQAQISDALLRDPALFGLPITPTARVPLWRGSPALIEVSGQVPSSEVREAVIRIVQEEAARIRPDFTIQNRLAVVPTMAAAA
jgi:hypothetical protein